MKELLHMQKSSRKEKERVLRARKIVAKLKKLYPNPKSELEYESDFQFLLAVVLSARSTDKKVNEVTREIFKKYKNACDFAQLSLSDFEKMISSIGFYRNKAKYIIKSAQIICKERGGKVPQSVKELMALPGIAYKSANVISGELFGNWEGIATDTHVRRFALKFDLCDSEDPNKISKCLENLIAKKDWKYVNGALVLYGRYVCPARKHDCTNHPLSKIWPKAASRWPRF